MAQQKEYSGYNGTLVLTDEGVIIKRGFKGYLFGGGKIRGDKTIPYSSIIAVQFKKAGMSVGYLQLTLVGGSEAKAGLMQATKDENTVNFYRKDEEGFTEAKEFIENKIKARSKSSSGNLDELEKLADLKNKGIITQEEFDTKKKSLLGL